MGSPRLRARTSSRRGDAGPRTRRFDPCVQPERKTSLFFNLSSIVLALTLFVVLFGATGAGLAIGRSQRHRSEHLREPFAALQAALLGMVGLLLAFGLAMAVGRYETRRAAVVDDANAIGATYLRAPPPRRRSAAPSSSATCCR